MFKITQGKGFSITFENGYTVSVQFGLGNYASNRNVAISTDYTDTQIKCGEDGSVSAECAVIAANGDFMRPGSWGDDVQGYCQPIEVLNLMSWAEQLPKAEQ